MFVNVSVIELYQAVVLYSVHVFSNFIYVSQYIVVIEAVACAG